MKCEKSLQHVAYRISKLISVFFANILEHTKKNEIQFTFLL